MAERKASARRSAAALRAKLQTASGAKASSAIATLGVEILGTGNGRIIAGFHAYRSEIDVGSLLAALTGKGWVTALPAIQAAEAPLLFRRWQPGDETIPGHFGIHIPHHSAELVRPDLVLLPMLAFDRAGYRLGYGGGYYDRTLELLRQTGGVTAIGVAFAGQEVDEVPRGPHDQPLDWILTECGALYPRRERGQNISSEDLCD